MRIGELARQSGCDVETVRFYEREGLLEAPAREANGYRRYTDAHLAQLHFVRHCRSLGMGLADIQILRRVQQHPDEACDEVNRLIDEQIGRIHAQVASLQVLEQRLLALRESCRTPHAARDCGIMQSLAHAAHEQACQCHAAQPDALEPEPSQGVDGPA